MSNMGSKEELNVRSPTPSRIQRRRPCSPNPAPQATLEAAFAKRYEGNEHFKKGEFQPALQCYHHVLLVLKGEP